LTPSIVAASFSFVVTRSATVLGQSAAGAGVIGRLQFLFVVFVSDDFDRWDTPPAIHMIAIAVRGGSPFLRLRR